MKSLFVSAMLLFFIGFYAGAQQFVSRYDGTGKGMDAVKAMYVDNAGNAYVTGSSYSGTNSDDYITIKYNSAGTKQWVARYNGPGNGSDVPNALFVDAAGNVYVTGYSDQLTGAFINNDATTIKYNAQGVQQWAARFDGVRQREDAGAAIKVDASGNVYITGFTTVNNGAYTKKDYLTIKYNSTGVQQWLATYNGPANKDDAAVGIGLDALGNVYVSGTSFAGPDPLGEEDYLTIKYSNAGVQQWTARYNGPVSEPDRATGLAVDNAGNSYVTGYSQGIGLDFATIKYNTNGVQQWVSRYNGAANSSDIAYAIALDNDGNVYVTGGDQTTIYNSDLRTVKYNNAGVQQWTARYNGPANDNDEAYAIAVDANKNVYVTGYVNGTSPSWNITTVKYNASGQQQWVKFYNGPGHDNDNGVAVGVDAAGNVYVAGTSTGASSNTDFVTIKYNAAGLREGPAVPETITLNTVPDKISIYPDPFNGSFTILLPVDKKYTVTMTDISGNILLQQKNVTSGTWINCGLIHKGIYQLHATDSRTVLEKQVIKQ